MKLESILTPFKVGLLVITGVVAAIAMIVALSGDVRMTESDTARYYAMFDDVTGLAVRSRIQMAGIPVGTIESIRLVGHRARVDIAVRRDIELYEGLEENGFFRNGATVSKRQASLIGDFYLEITPGTAGRVLIDSEEIKNVISVVGPEELFERLNQITQDIQAVTESLALVFGGDQAQQTVQQMMDDLASVLAVANKFVEDNSGKLDQIVTDATHISRDMSILTRRGTESIDTILQDTEAIVREVRYIVGQSTTDVQAGLGTLQGTLARLQRTLDSLNYSLQNVQDITEKINEGEGTIGELVNNPAIAQRTEQILDDAGEFMGRITRLRTLIELRSEYHVANRQAKNVFGLRLQPNPYKYYLIEFIDDFRGSTTVVTEQVNTTDASAGDPLYQETRVTTTDRFKLSLIYARGMEVNPWVSFTGRFGIMESTGGLGGYMSLFPDKSLQFGADIFDFSSSPNPRVRAQSTYRFFEHAFISAGLDDILNEGRRDYFFGAGIRFDDEDLKALLTTTGVPAGF